MDEVIADSLSRFLVWYERDHGIKLDPDQLQGKKVHEIVGNEHRELLRGYPHQAHFFKDLPVMADSQEVIRRLSERYEIYIASAAMEFHNSFSDKYHWLLRHFDFIHWRNFVFCGDKSIINADFLIDDHAFNFDGFRGEGILFTAPHNINETRYRRANSWREIEKMFL